MHLSKTIIETPVGKMLAIASEKGLSVLTFQKDSQRIPGRLEKDTGVMWGNQFSETLETTKRWLNDYFLCRFSTLHSPKLDLQGTPFAKAAWQALLEIPAGRTQSYGELAKAIGSPKASRAIGRVMGQNPIAIIVPCHRIIGSAGSLTGYGGGLHRKQWLLKHEGLF